MTRERRAQQTVTAFVTDPDALGIPPSAADVPARTWGAPARAFALLVLMAAVAAGLIVLSRAFDLGGLLTSLTQLGGLLILLVGLFVLVPVLRGYRAVSRWNAAYLALAAQPVRSTARIVEIDRDWRGTRCVVTGRVRYGDPGSERELALGNGSLRPLLLLLDRGQVPSIGSQTVVWHAPDHSVVLIRVHADGSGG